MDLDWDWVDLELRGPLCGFNLFRDVQRDTRVYAVGFRVLKTPGPFWVSDLPKKLAMGDS